MSSNKSDIIFHLLDLQSRDVRVESEQNDVREVVYESLSDDDDDDEEFQKKRRGKKSSQPAPAMTRQYTIHLFGSTEEGKPLRCDVSGFRPSFYLRLPEKESLIPTAIESIRKYLDKQRIPLKELEFKRVMKHVFYGFTAKRFYPFLEISFPSLYLFRNAQNLFLDEFKNFSTKYPLDPPLRGTTVEVFESNIDPMLRFLHTQNIQPCGWVCVRDGQSSIVEETDEGIVIECDYEQIVPIKGTRVSAPFLTASWDIECCSYTGDFPLAKRTWIKTSRELADYLHSHSELNSTDLYQLVVQSVCEGDRPTPNVPKGITPVYGSWKSSMDSVMKHVTSVKTCKELDSILEKGVETYDELVEWIEKCLNKVFGSILQLNGDPVIQIGTTLTRGTVESTERHLFVFPDCAPIQGIEVHAYPNEKQMIEAWFEWMIQRNPDILIGYNVFGFDEAYLWHRAEELGLITSNSIIHAMTRLFDLGSEMKLEEKFLSSSAMGDNRMYIWNTHGRLQIDMFHYIKRGYTLPSYKLDEVTKHFMSGKLKSYEYDQTSSELVLTVAGAIKDMKVGRSITLLDETGETVTPKLMVNSIEKDVLRVEWKWDEEVWAEMADAKKWVVVKDDVGPQDIFRLHRESTEGRAIVGKYCLQDCDLVIDLYKKLETFNNSMSMANVCSVPVSYIFTRGQGIKIESLIFKFCREKDVLIPVLSNPKKSNEGETYEGAIVLDPEPGFYSTSPIGVCDFASLYPSTIVSENISHDSLLWVKDFTYDGEWIADQWGSETFDEHPGFAYTDIEFDIIRPDPNDHRKTPNKIKCGRRVCRYAKPLDGTKSTLPQITTWLLNARSAKKKEMKAEKDPERYALLDSEQLAYKLTGNSLYGQLGSGTFKIRLQALAASVTAYGRKQILFAKAAIEKFYGPEAKDPRCAAKCMAKVVYGDSVSGDTPIVIKNMDTNELYIKRMDEFYNNSLWNEYHTTKEFIDLSNTSLCVWTERGFTPIKKIIRHRLAPEKKMFRIHTHTGVVDVTEDHSLVLKNGDEIKPEDVKLGTELLHNDLLFQEFNNSDQKCNITLDEAFVMGLFVADGSSDIYECDGGSKKATWAINKADMNLLEFAQTKCPFPTKILDTIKSSGVYKLIPVGDHVTPARHYREMFYNSHREKRVPEIILNAPIPIIQEFWNGFYAGDGDKDKHNFIRFDQKGKEIGAGLYIIARRLGYSVSINDRVSKDRVFRYTMTRGNQRKNPDAIKKIRQLPHPQDAYVYDLETENHHFGVGPGALIVHNTDSLFVQFNVKNPETGELLQGREARQATIDITDEAGHFITKSLAPPHDFEFDKAFDPLLMFSKKRYAGNMYEENADDYVHKYMGIALKRRDNAPIVKTIYGGAMKMLLNSRDVEGAYHFVRNKCIELVRGEVSMGQLMVTKSLRDHYADPSRIAHKALADRIALRDPGNAPAAGDRIGYVYICPKGGQEASKLQGDRIETPTFIKENQLTPDYRHYIEHQLMNPISQAFALLLEQIPCFEPHMTRGCPTAKENLDGYLVFREKVAAELLFTEALKFYDRLHRNQSLTAMFGKQVTIVTKTQNKTVVEQKTDTTIIQTTSSSKNSAGGKKQTLLSSFTTPMKQTTMSSYFMDEMIVKDLNKRKQSSKKKEQELKEQKEQKEPVEEKGKKTMSK
jgi:DNA polymerase elongation subunit (family B)